jgi:hypothetical protein
MAGHKIAALDIATTCGWACGVLGETPRAGSMRFGVIGRDSPDDIFAAALIWADGFFRLERPDLLILEAMLPPDAMKGQTSRQTRDRLAGLHGIMRGVARKAGVAEIATATVGDIRSHFIGGRMERRAAAKRETLRRCVMLHWPADDDNAADALAAWSYACALIDPTWALRVTPLFNRALRVVAQ